jgi:hypothetical protein
MKMGQEKSLAPRGPVRAGNPEWEHGISERPPMPGRCSGNRVLTELRATLPRRRHEAAAGWNDVGGVRPRCALRAKTQTSRNLGSEQKQKIEVESSTPTTTTAHIWLNQNEKTNNTTQEPKFEFFIENQTSFTND